MPDPYVARKSIWLPYMRDVLKVDESTILIGHSSGAEAALRFLENDKVAYCVLVSACYTDLGCSNEKASGYYDDPWNWGAISKNAQKIIQYHSKDDKSVPVEEGRHVANAIASEFHELDGKLHFYYPEDVQEIYTRICDLVSKNT